jgi:GNAT superfamily N-acetyltransferase
MVIEYRHDRGLQIEQVRELYIASTLGERRPVDDRACFQEMIERADILVSAWEGDLLVGVARTLTDFCYVAYLADLAVRQSHQRRGIGRSLVAETRAVLGEAAYIVLLAAPAAEQYYPRIGFNHHPQAWILRQGDELR